jgi:dihydroorotase
VGHTKEPRLERDVRQQGRQGYIELEEDLLEYIIDLVIVLEHATDVEHQWSAISSYQEFKGALITCQSLLYQSAIRDFLLLEDSVLLRLRI